MNRVSDGPDGGGVRPNLASLVRYPRVRLAQRRSHGHHHRPQGGPEQLGEAGVHAPTGVGSPVAVLRVVGSPPHAVRIVGKWLRERRIAFQLYANVLRPG